MKNQLCHGVVRSLFFNKYLKMGIVWRPWIVLLCKQKQYEFIFCYV